jgi:hypothetical protein
MWGLHKSSSSSSPSSLSLSLPFGELWPWDRGSGGGGREPTMAAGGRAGEGPDPLVGGRGERRRAGAGGGPHYRGRRCSGDATMSRWWGASGHQGRKMEGGMASSSSPIPIPSLSPPSSHRRSPPLTPRLLAHACRRKVMKAISLKGIEIIHFSCVLVIHLRR